MARVTEMTTSPTPAAWAAAPATTVFPTNTSTPLGLRAEFAQFGRRWANSITRLVCLSVDLDRSGEWAFDGSPTCAHWIAAMLDIEVGTAREWLRIGRALEDLPRTNEAFTAGELSYTKLRTMTRIATPTNEADLIDIALRTAAGDLGRALATWSAQHDDEAERERRHRRARGMRWRTEPDGMVSCTLNLTPEQAATLTAAVDAQVTRSDGREPADPALDVTGDVTNSEIDASATRESNTRWSSLAQQRVDALVHLVSHCGAKPGGDRNGSNVTTEVILHVRADGCTLDDGTPIAGSVVERIASTAALRAMIHDAERNPINVSGRHRHHTDRQKRLVKERDKVCVDCGSGDLLQYDHVPNFEDSRRTLVEETELRCAPCHHRRHDWPAPTAQTVAGSDLRRRNVTGPQPHAARHQPSSRPRG